MLETCKNEQTSKVVYLAFLGIYFFWPNFGSKLRFQTPDLATNPKTFFENCPILKHVHFQLESFKHVRMLLEA